MDKIDLEFLHVDKGECDTITITNPEKVSVKNNDTDGCFDEFPKDCVLTVTDAASEEILEYIQVDAENGIPIREERRLRKENTLVKELYEEYRVALILAHKGDY